MRSIASGKFSRTAHSSRGRRKAPCPGYRFSIVCGPVARTDAQHRLREIQPHRTQLPGAAQSALPGLQVQHCLRAGSPDRCAASPPGISAAPHTAPGGGAKRLARATDSASSAGRQPGQMRSIASGKLAAPHTARGGGAKRLARATDSASSAGR
ncbi:hypothetical protein AI2623V1_0203 [Klebsiella oxytoca]|nr:hypothetical protein AI2623V1_0203 [Klebsiella oxytoca]CAH4953258.1 hypothetical protein AI2623V1_0203 [Klebsiella oxytoca]